MQADGTGWLYVPAGLNDGPLPTHYEPHESPFDNALYAQRANPARGRFPRSDNPYNPTGGHPASRVFPRVFATYRLTELMKRRLGRLLAEPYEKEKAGRYDKIARALTVAGAAMMGLAGRKSRVASVVGGALVLAGAATERWSVFEAGFQSARDPKYTVMSQRERLEARDGSRVG